MQSEQKSSYEELSGKDFKEILLDLNKSAIVSDGFPSHVQSFTSAFVSSLLSGKCLDLKYKLFAKKLFKYADLNLILLQQLNKCMKDKLVIDANGKCKLIHFLVALPIPTKFDFTFFGQKLLVEGKICLDRVSHRLYLQRVWLQILSIEFAPKLYRLILPHFIENVMDDLPNGEFFADILYKLFRLGNFMSVLSLAGIFKLIVNRNFEHPDFYVDVYRIMGPTACYSNYYKKFYDLVDLVTSSSHIPVYIICAFVKKLCRILLFAPAHCQLPIVHLVKNILCRHATAHAMLVHRKEPQTLATDPYDEEEMDLQKCGAVDSSLWELRAIRCHWLDKISAKADFGNQNMQDEEMSLGWKEADDLFRAVVGRALVRINSPKKAEVDKEEEEEPEEEGNPEEEGPEVKRRRKLEEGEPRKKMRQGNGVGQGDGIYPHNWDAPWALF